MQMSQMLFEACSSTSATPTILRTPIGSCASSSLKGSDFGKVTNEEVQHTVELICDRARKVLKYRTANEVFREMLHSA
ncbi:MAG: hypothetical protein DUD39_00510 [Coriobacteriaceae bacterium]|nr:MAG: hypothetical protein DUD39_00510 [Coriobacteriaceae bacterium]